MNSTSILFEKLAIPVGARDQIREDVENGTRSGVNGTPAFFIHRRRYEVSPIPKRSSPFDELLQKSSR